MRTRTRPYNTPVEDLSDELLHVTPVDRDWSFGWPDQWDWLKAPACPWCGDAKQQEEDSYEWVCPTRSCPNYGEQIEEHDLDGGPMMNYAYPLGDSYDVDDAVKIAHLPLVIVQHFEGYGETSYELALSGGGMDFSWQICEAYMLLGYLPPVHFADLPRMAG